jgi:hypothetical protein
VTEQLDPAIELPSQRISHDVSFKLKLVPVTVTAEPVPPWFGLSVIDGVTIVKVSDAEPGITWAQLGGVPVSSVNVIVYGVRVATESRTVKLPVRCPLESTLHASVAGSQGTGDEGFEDNCSIVAFLQSHGPALYPDPERATTTAPPAVLGVIASLDRTENTAFDESEYAMPVAVIVYPRYNPRASGLTVNAHDVMLPPETGHVKG